MNCNKPSSRKFKSKKKKFKTRNHILYIHPKQKWVNVDFVTVKTTNFISKLQWRERVAPPLPPLLLLQILSFLSASSTISTPTFFFINLSVHLFFKCLLQFLMSRLPLLVSWMPVCWMQWPIPTIWKSVPLFSVDYFSSNYWLLV